MLRIALIATVLFASSLHADEAPKATWTVSPQVIRLSEAVKIHIEIEGTAPLRIETAKDFFDVPTAEIWRLHPDPKISLVDLPDGKQRWTADYVADPFVAGESVILTVAPIQVTVGLESEPRSVPLPGVSIQVITGIPQPPRADAARSVTGVEDPPTPAIVEVPEPRSINNRTLALGGAGICLFGYLLRRFLRRKPAPRPPEVVLQEELQALENLEISAHDFAERLSSALRDYTERVTGAPASTSTTVELFTDLSRHGSLFARIAADLESVLTTCDLLRFDPHPQSFNRDALLEAAGRIASAKVARR